jgi:hypothetical protein
MMFSKKEFYKVNREERHFGFLLMASIIFDDDFRKYFFELINESISQESFLDNNDFDIYSEVAIFRDYWNDLGDYEKYTQELHSQRKKIIEIFLEHFNINRNIIYNYSLFWTGRIGESKLWFPGRWPVPNINTIQREENLTDRQLLRLRWACNAKPDVMIISKKSGLFIELKVESELGANNYGYDQQETQFDILKLVCKTVPIFKETNFKRIMITKDENNLFSWKKIKNHFNNDLIKKHMINMPI